MSTATYTLALNLICGAFLLAAVLMLLRRDLAAIVRLLTIQGVLLAALAALLGAREGSVELYGVAFGVLLLKAVALPLVLRRVLRNSGEARETEPLVNVTSSMLAATLLTLLAYAVSRPLVALSPSPATEAVPIGWPPYSLASLCSSLVVGHFLRSWASCSWTMASAQSRSCSPGACHSSSNWASPWTCC